MKRFKKRTHKVGLPPGTLIHIGEKKTEHVNISIIDYNEKLFQEKEVESIEDCFQYKDKSIITWIKINGVHQTDIIEKLGKHFNIHPLILEDVVNTDQRPKIDIFDEYIFIIIKIPYYDDEKQKVDTEQISIILGNNFVISFQESEKYFFKPIRERLKKLKYPNDPFIFGFGGGIYYRFLKFDYSHKLTRSIMQNNQQNVSLTYMFGFKNYMIRVIKSEADEMFSSFYNYYEQNGYVLEARLKKHVKIDDKFHDVVIHSKFFE